MEDGLVSSDNLDDGIVVGKRENEKSGWFQKDDLSNLVEVEVYLEAVVELLNLITGIDHLLH